MITMRHRNADPDSFAVLATIALWFAAAAALLLPGCSPVSGEPNPSSGPGCDPDFIEQEPNDAVTEFDRIPVTLAPGDVFTISGELGGDTVNANGQPGTRDWFRCDAGAPCQVNVRVWLDGIGFIGVALVEWLDESTYELRASDHSGAGYIEQTITVGATEWGSGIGIGILESSMSAPLGTPYCISVTVL